MALHTVGAHRGAGLCLTPSAWHGACLGVLLSPNSMSSQAWGSHGSVQGKGGQQAPVRCRCLGGGGGRGVPGLLHIVRERQGWQVPAWHRGLEGNPSRSPGWVGGAYPFGVIHSMAPALTGHRPGWGVPHPPPLPQCTNVMHWANSNNTRNWKPISRSDVKTEEVYNGPSSYTCLTGCKIQKQETDRAWFVVVCRLEVTQSVSVP
uniref:Uncharacterized protein n=1 Tax=Pipistrellus kuhlii TaxID=59472 RepID=A0A7J7V121_PIPKU|nr:hypothetical protein mPipKuh1_008658 [Pipistrellus kuhlii]